MLTLATRMTVEGLSAADVTDFMLSPSDEAYRAWWPGTHLAFHLLRSAARADHVGDVVWMDEYVGSRRLRWAAQVVEAVPGEKIVWRLGRWRVWLPVRLELAVEDGDHGVLLHHCITAGWPGTGRIFDPLWRLFFSASFEAAMDDHAHTEFRRLDDLLSPPGEEAVP